MLSLLSSHNTRSSANSIILVFTWRSLITTFVAFTYVFIYLVFFIVVLRHPFVLYVGTYAYTYATPLPY